MNKQVLQSLIFCISFLFLFTSCNTKKTPIVYVFSKTEGFRHKSIEVGIESIKNLGNKNDFIVKTTEDSDSLISNLSEVDAVIFLNTTGDIFNNKQQNAFESYMNNGGGFIGVHSAADTEHDWVWYGELVGAYFKSHPKSQQATINVVDKNHLATNFLGDTWVKFDEWYNYKNINPNVNVLMYLDEQSYEGGENEKNHPISWYHTNKGGPAFFTGLGHTPESYSDPMFIKHLLGGITYVIKN